MFTVIEAECHRCGKSVVTYTMSGERRLSVHNVPQTSGKPQECLGSRQRARKPRPAGKKVD